MASREITGEPLNDALARLQQQSTATATATEEQPSAPQTTLCSLLAQDSYPPESESEYMPWAMSPDGSTRCWLVLAVDVWGSTFEQAWVGYHSAEAVRAEFLGVFAEERLLSATVTEISPLEVYRSGRTWLQSSPQVAL
jgi:hypothetical protein